MSLCGQVSCSPIVWDSDGMVNMMAEDADLRLVILDYTLIAPYMGLVHTHALVHTYRMPHLSK